MKSLLLLTSLILAVSSSFTVAAENIPASPEIVIMDLESQWAKCFLTGNPDAAKQFIADDFIGTTSKGVRYGKAEALNQIISAKGKFSSFFTKDVAVKVYGNAAVARGIDIWKMAGSESKQRSSTWTDTWIRIEGKWRLVAAQDAESQPSK